MKSTTRQLLTDVLALLHHQNTKDTQFELVKADIAKHLQSEKNSFQITSVSRADLESIGFNVDKITDEQMLRLSDKMANDYCEQLYWTSLIIIAENLEFPTKYNKLSQNEFWQMYKPIQNHFIEDGSFDGCYFKSDGAELDYVLSKVKQNIVWTIVDGDSHTRFILSGLHSINRVGYLVTEIPYCEDIQIEI